VKNYYSELYDVAIIGGGPAGASAAFYLVKENKKVILLEKETLPRYKTCGGGVVFRVNSILPHGFKKVAENDCYVAEVVDHRAGVNFSIKRNFPIVSMVMRDNFDIYLIDESRELGANVLENFEVKNAIMRSNFVEVIGKGEKKVFSKYVISADGAMGAISKKINLANKIIKIPALESEVHVDEYTFSRYKNNVRFDFDILPNGYGWVFPKQKHLSIGVVRMKKGNIDLKEMLKYYFDFLGLEKVNKIEQHGYVIPFNKSFSRITNERILLVGDAAALADPLTGEGISSAILSGKFAAEAIIEGGENNFKVEKLYNNKVKNSILKEHRYAKIIAVIAYSFPQLRALLFKKIGYPLSELMTDIIAGEKKYSTIMKNPLNYFKLIKSLFFHIT